VNVVDLLRRQAAERPDAAALVEGVGRRRRVVTFGELDVQAGRGAGRLRAAGLEPGDAVLVLVPLSARLYDVLAAVFRAGLVAVVLDPGAGRAHVEASCRLRPPDALVGTPRAHLLRALVPAVREIPRRFVVGGWAPGAARWEGGEAPVPPAPVQPRAPALLTFTSGTTGRPKAAVRTHRLLAAQHAALAEALDLQPGHADLATLPVVVLAALASGVTTVLPAVSLRRPGETDVRRLGRQIRAERPTRCTASPAFFERLLSEARPGDLASFRRFDTGGAPVFPDLLDRLGATGAHAAAVYGSTEAEPVAHLDADSLTDADRQRVAGGAGLPAGRPVPHVDLRVVPDRWGKPLGPFTEDGWDRQSLGPGVAGEVVVAGDHVVPGYLGGAGDAETKVEVAGRRWHRTGDAGRLDGAGRLWLLGRCAGVSRRLGSAVYPLQVEAALRERLGVRAAFLDLDGRRVVAVEGAAPAGLAGAVAWAEVDRVAVVRRIPTDRRHNAKVDRAALRALLVERGA
jgi:acyl-CoA synthetase (AMP-forming)/AMP-acid ligase II